MSLIRQLLSFLRAPERVALLFTDRGDGTSGPVVTFHEDMQGAAGVEH